MNRVPKILLLLVPFLVLTFQDSLGTGQAPDRLIWKGDTLSLFSNPLESHPGIKRLKSLIFQNKKEGFNTACWRGYEAEWIIIDNKLYLQNIYSCEYSDDSVKSDLGAVFGTHFRNGRVAAEWVNEELYIPQGRCLHYIHDGYESIYVREIGLVINNGTVLKVHQYDNSKTNISKYLNNWELTEKDILSNVNWDSIPPLEEGEIRIYVGFFSGDSPKPQKPIVLKGSDNELFNQEVVKAILKLSDWDVFYRHGKVQEFQYALAVKLNEVNRKKYAIVGK